MGDLGYRVTTYREVSGIQYLLRAVERGQDLGADYVDARLVDTEREIAIVSNGQIRSVIEQQQSGVAIRILVDGSWGFATTNRLTDKAILAAVEEAGALARSAPGLRRRVSLSPEMPQVAEYETPVATDPFSIPISDKVDFLRDVSSRLLAVPGVSSSTANIRFDRDRIRFVSSEGADIKQVITWGGGGLAAVAEGNGQVQKRTYPRRGDGGSGWGFQTGGWEIIEDIDLPGNVNRVGTQAVKLLSAPPCPTGATTIILDQSMMSLQVHESIGHPIEMDRVLGDELANFGGSFIPLDQVGSYRYATDIVNVNADATTPRGAGSFGFDDEGVPAQCTPIIRDGVLVDLLTSRDTAPLLGRTSNGTMRSVDAVSFPIIRMTNINLLPGDSSLERMIAETDDGLLFDTYRSYDIDDMRLNFTFAADVGWQIRNGRIVGMVRNPSYTSNSKWMWNHCDAIAGPDEWKLLGTSGCGKGQPWQFIRVGHGVSPARFRDIQVGV